MIAIHENKLRKVINEFSSEIDNHIVSVTKKLAKHINRGGWFYEKINGAIQLVQFKPEELKYLRLLKFSLKRIIHANVDDLRVYTTNFDNIISKAYRDNEANKFIQFKDELLKVLGYSILRSNEKYALYPKFYDNLGLRACVYCNSQLTITVDNKGGKKSAKFEVDHFIPKSDYPCFSISFFNLYPVCSSCNGKKSNNVVNFLLYSNKFKEIKESYFEFEIDKKSIAKFRLSCVESELIIKFKDSINSGLNETFLVEGIYNTQKDLAAEIILKSLIYNKSYQNTLKRSFEKLYGDRPLLFNRLILGNYSEVTDIHKRPMAKFTQDIGKQLKLIK
jgi:5-methylcytosine-specific restriction endonuclease McrA